MKITGLTVVVLATLLGGVDASEFATVEEVKKAAFDAEKLGTWKEIKWVRTADEALKAAQKEKKPIVVFTLVSELGRKGAAQT